MSSTGGRYIDPFDENSSPPAWPAPQGSRPAPPSSGRPNTRYCPNCGREMGPYGSQCGFCGARGSNPGVPSGQKSKITAGLLGIFLGGLGIHSFYLGYTRRGILQIVVTILTLGVGALWGFIEGILILADKMPYDANGNPLGQ